MELFNPLPSFLISDSQTFFLHDCFYFCEDVIRCKELSSHFYFWFNGGVAKWDGIAQSCYVY